MLARLTITFRPFVHGTIVWDTRIRAPAPRKEIYCGPFGDRMMLGDITEMYVQQFRGKLWLKFAGTDSVLHRIVLNRVMLR